MLNGVSRGGDGCQDGPVLPVDVGLDAPVEAQNGHQEDDDGPEDPPEPGLVGEEDVDQALVISMQPLAAITECSSTTLN